MKNTNQLSAKTGEKQVKKETHSEKFALRITPNQKVKLIQANMLSYRKTGVKQSTSAFIRELLTKYTEQTE
jgi:hypothetical protein